ncbi:MAG: hypothetical protein RLZZ08_1523, partial [Pseudomonadota bacterium]
NAAKLGQTFADANRGTKPGQIMRDIAKAILGAADSDDGKLADNGGTSLLGKLDFKSLLAKKSKGPKQAANAD